MSLPLIALAAAAPVFSQDREADLFTGAMPFTTNELIVAPFEGTLRFCLPPLSPDATVVFSDPGSAPHKLDLKFVDRSSPFKGPILTKKLLKFKEGAEGIFHYRYGPKTYRIVIVPEGGLKYASFRVVDDPLPALRVMVAVPSGQQLICVKEGLLRDVKVNMGGVQIDLPAAGIGKGTTLVSPKGKTLIVSFVNPKHEGSSNLKFEVVGGEEAEVTIDPGG
ncbi:MAG: hypothetical protein QNK37_27635 [Acidobacteriota bacterium]|nr:hypothetical protein [Acidobacteriota bacterium]